MMKRDTVAIVVAMGREMEMLSEMVLKPQKMEHQGRTIISGYIGNQHVALMQSGIGKVCAATAAVELIHAFAPRLIISSGVAGGIDARLKLMDVVVSEDVAHHDVWCGEGNEEGQVQGFPTRYVSHAVNIEQNSVLKGLICSGDQFITDREALSAIKSKFPEALAVDMESAALAQTCHIYGVPFLSCRVISDTPDATEEHATQYASFWEMAPQRSVAVVRRIIETL